MAEISFRGRVAIVTGAGGGIGRTYALEIARRGGAVVVNDLGGDVFGRGGSASMAASVVAEIHAAGGLAVSSHDSVATHEGAEAIVATALQHFGRLDVLVNNAGNMRNGLIGEADEDDFAAVHATHLRGAFNMVQAAWPQMRAQKYGRVLFTASSAGLFGNYMQAAYASAKAGVAGLMNVAAIEGEPLGILCNAIMPTAHSRMAAQMGVDLGEGGTDGAAGASAAVGNAMDPAFNTPLAVYLVSEECRSTHALYSHCAGRYARVFVGAAHGWQGPRDAPASVEDVAAHFAEIGDLSRGYVLPQSPRDEFRLVLSAPG